MHILKCLKLSVSQTVRRVWKYWNTHILLVEMHPLWKSFCTLQKYNLLILLISICPKKRKATICPYKDYQSMFIEDLNIKTYKLKDKCVCKLWYIHMLNNFSEIKLSIYWYTGQYGWISKGYDEKETMTNEFILYDSTKLEL